MLTLTRATFYVTVNVNFRHRKFKDDFANMGQGVGGLSGRAVSACRQGLAGCEASGAPSEVCRLRSIGRALRG